MVDLAQRLATYRNVPIRGVVANPDCSTLAPDCYDCVYAANPIHHISSREAFFGGSSQTLKRDGILFCWDPLAYNPMINVYRRMATKVHSEGERPLTFKDIALARRFAWEVDHREFRVLTLAIFLAHVLTDRIHPNQDR